MSRVHHIVIGLTLLAILPGSSAAYFQDGDSTTASEETVDPRWLDRLDPDDRALVDANIGFAPPELTDEVKAGLEYIGVESLSWDELRGKVIVLQSWTSRTEAGRAAPNRAKKTIEDIGSSDVALIALHSPEGEENALKYLDQRPLEIPVVIDREGLLLDEFGIYKRATNVVIDRNGTVRYAGLNAGGLKAAVSGLLEESFDPASTPQPREAPAPPAEAPAEVAFPSDMGTGSGARDMRGQRAPDFFVQQWLNGQPDAKDKVVMVEFWATW